VTAVASIAATAAAEDVVPRVAAAAALLACSDSDHQRLAAGEIVTVRSSAGPRSRDALAVVVAATPAAVMRAMDRADLGHAGRRVYASVEIPAGEPTPSVFASLPLDAVAAADEWNLAVTEQALLRDVSREEEGERELAAIVRHVLAERSAAYRSGGTRAIAPYARPGTGAFSAGSEADAMWASLARIDALAPGIHAAFAAYPRPAPLDLRHSYSASVVAHGGRPVLVLSHRARSSSDAYEIVIEREFFVSRGYLARQTVFGAASASDGRAIAFYLTSMTGAAPLNATAVSADEPSEVDAFFAQLRGRGARAN
jgi:hypothetical protein